MNLNKTLSPESGFTGIAAFLDQSGAPLAKSLQLTPPARLLNQEYVERKLLKKIVSSYTPPPPDRFVSLMIRGMETHIIERFGQAGLPAECTSNVRETYHLISPDQGPT